MNIHRALRAVGHALGMSDPALVMFVRFDVGFSQAAIAPVTSHLVSR